MYRSEELKKQDEELLEQAFETLGKDLDAKNEEYLVSQEAKQRRKMKIILESSPLKAKHQSQYDRLKKLLDL